MNGGPVIVDTNVVVAALLTNHDESPVARILDGMLGARFVFVLSEVLLTEYRGVLMRPALRKLHGLAVTDVEVLLTDIARHAVVLAPVAGPSARDAGDQLLWDLLATRADLRLVTGDTPLLRSPAMRGSVSSPRDFVESP